MRKTASRIVLLLILPLLGCGGEVELRPEIQSHLDEYEQLIDSYQPKFAGARGNQATYAQVADAYSREARAWMERWSTIAPNPSDEEGKAITAQIDRLNQRAVRMLQGS